jgi:hypothetical protein
MITSQSGVRHYLVLSSQGLETEASNGWPVTVATFEQFPKIIGEAFAKYQAPRDLLELIDLRKLWELGENHNGKSFTLGYGGVTLEFAQIDAEMNSAMLADQAAA